MTFPSYGHHVRVCTEKSQTSLRLEKAIFGKFVLNEEYTIRQQVSLTISEESKGTFVGVSVGFREFQVSPGSTRIDVMYFQ